MELTVGELIKATGGKLLSGSEDVVVRHLSIDSREIGNDTLFIPVIGERSDGHVYLPAAAEKGAAALFASSREAARGLKGSGVPVILVRDTVEALQAVGKAVRKKLSMPAVGITGSVGKTTTRELVYRALSGGMKAFKTSKNYNNRLGVPLTLSEIPSGAEILVLELGLNVPGELGTISALTNIDTAVITNIGTAHMEYYGSREGLAKEKFTVTKGFWPENPRPKKLFLNGDDPYLQNYRAYTEYPVSLFGFGPDNDYRAVNVRSENGTYVFDFLAHGSFVRTVSLSALGRHNVLNAAAALAVALHYGVDVDLAAESLAPFTGFQGRLEWIECGGALVIDDTYNASPASMSAGLSVLSELSFGTGKKVAVLGDMLELGDNTALLHEEVGAKAAKEQIDEYLLVGRKAHHIAEGLKKAGSTGVIREFENREEARDYLMETFSAGNIYYFKASHGMAFAGLVEEIRNAFR